MFKIQEKKNSSQQHIEKMFFKIFKICELNFELVHVESELSQHW